MSVFAPFATDFYKTGHYRQYSSGTEYVYSNFTCRSDKNANLPEAFDHKVVNFGLQGVITNITENWSETFFHLPKQYVVDKYKRMMDACLGPDAVSVEHIAALHDLGYFPIRIKALPEGVRVPIRVPIFTIENTLPEFYWITNYLETQIAAELWKSIT